MCSLGNTERVDKERVAAVGRGCLQKFVKEWETLFESRQSAPSHGDGVSLCTGESHIKSGTREERARFYGGGRFLYEFRRKGVLSYVVEWTESSGLEGGTHT